jgi:twinkle protein
LASAERGIAFLDARKPQVISGDQINWERYLTPGDKSRVVPAEALVEKGRAEILLGAQARKGLTLPWEKTHCKVLMTPGSLIVWAGWSRHGKSMMLKQVMLHAIAQSEKPLIASMEETILRVWKDMARQACRTDEPSPKELDRYAAFVNGKLWFYDQQGTVDPRKIQAVIRYAATELKVTQVVVDSLMMLAVSRDDYEAQHKFVSELKTTAKDTNTTVHLVCHMRKREGKGGEETPGTLHDISGGHEIGSIADTVIIPWRDIKGQANPPCVIRIDKQRGDIDWLGTIGLNFHERSRQFVEDVHPQRFWDEGEEF